MQTPRSKKSPLHPPDTADPALSLRWHQARWAGADTELGTYRIKPALRRAPSSWGVEGGGNSRGVREPRAGAQESLCPASCWEEGTWGWGGRSRTARQPSAFPQALGHGKVLPPTQASPFTACHLPAPELRAVILPSLPALVLLFVFSDAFRSSARPCHRKSFPDS